MSNLFNRRRLWLWGAGVLALGVAAILIVARLDLVTRGIQWAVDRELVKISLPEQPPIPFKLRGAEYKPFRAVSKTSPSASTDRPVRLLETPLNVEPANAAGPFSVMLDGHQRNALVGKIPFAFNTDIQVPENAELWLSLNCELPKFGFKSVRFRVTVREAGRDQVVLDRLLSTLRAEWESARIDLSKWTGRKVRLHFESTAGEAAQDPGTSPDDHARAFWGDLVVRSNTAHPKHPNIIVILLDTLRPDHLGAYGYQRPTSPNIDALTAAGVRFDRAISSAPWTDPSIMAIFTSMHPSDLWEVAPYEKWIRKPVPDEVPTLASVLSEAGYYSIAASDHPGINPNRFGRGFDVYSTLFYGDGEYTKWRKTAPEKLLERFAKLLKSQNAGDGLFVYLHLIYPHIPYVAPKKYLDLFGPGTDKLEKANREQVINLYDAEVRMTDDVVGAVMEILAAHNISKDSILVLLSDHGEGFWEHGLFEHGNSLYNELLKVTLIMHAPGRLPAGKSVTQTVRLIDVMPTLLDLAGVDAPPELRGASMLDLIRDRPGENRLAYSEYPHSDIVYGHAIQSEALKLIVPKTNEDSREIYDLARDPKELTPLKAFPTGGGLDAMAGTMESLRSTAEQHRSNLHTEEEAPSKDTIERLRTMGYVDD